jgi:hypothetical protein
MVAETPPAPEGPPRLLPPPPGRDEAPVLPAARGLLVALVASAALPPLLWIPSRILCALGSDLPERLYDALFSPGGAAGALLVGAMLCSFLLLAARAVPLRVLFWTSILLLLMDGAVYVKYGFLGIVLC